MKIDKLAFLADVHLGNHKRFGGPVVAGINTRCEMTLDVLDRAVTGALNEGCSAVIVVGDLFDYSRPEAQLLRAAQRIFHGDPPAYIIVGNHDQISTAEGDHALGPLMPEAHIVEKAGVILKTDDLELIAVPFQPGQAHEWLPPLLRGIVQREDAGSVARQSVRTRRVLALHLGIKDDKTVPWLAAAPDAVHIDVLRELCRECAISHVFAGNWHDQRAWEFHYPEHGNYTLNVVQIGALVPTGWDNPGLKGYGGVAILHVKSGKVEMHEHFGPRFIAPKTSTDLDKALKAARKTDNKLFVSESAYPEELTDRAQALASVRDSGAIVDFEVLPDTTIAQAQVRSAASAARSKKTLDEAVDAYVSKMPLAEDVPRDEVLNKVRGYLR